MNEKVVNKYYTFLDFETTGIGDAMPVSLAILSYLDGKKVYAKYFLINPEKEISYQAQKVHGISQEEVVDKPTFAEIWEEIKPYISGQIVIAHNAKFDCGVIDRCVKYYKLDCDNYESICTCDNAKKLIPKPQIINHKLDTLCEYFGIEFENHHTASFDTVACMRIFNELVELSDGELELKKRNPCDKEEIKEEKKIKTKNKEKNDDDDFVF